MICSHCGAEIPDSAVFCSSCGKPVQAAADVTEHDVAEAAEKTVEQAAETVEAAAAAASTEAEDALARLKAEMEEAGELAAEPSAEAAAEADESVTEVVETAAEAATSAAATVATVAPVTAPSEPASPVEPTASAPAQPAQPPQPPQPVQPAQGYAAPAGQTMPSPVPTPAPSQQSAYTPSMPASQPGSYSYQPAAAAGPVAATAAKKSPVAKIAIAAVALALAGFLLFWAFGRNNPGGGGGPVIGGGSEAGYELVDAEGNPTLYSVLELNGADLVSAIENEGFAWEDERKWWLSSDGNDAFYVSSNNQYEFLRPEIVDLDVNGGSDSCVYVIVVDDRDYRNGKDAFNKLCNIEVVDVEWFEDDLGIAVVKSPSGTVNLVLIDVNEDIGLYVLDVFNERAVSSGLFEEFVGEGFGRSIEEIWNNVAGRSIEPTGGTASAVPTVTAPSTSTVGTPSQGAVGSVASGFYTVGEDLPAGEYKLDSDSDSAGYYAVYADNTSTEIDNIIYNENFDTCSYVTLRDGQYVEFVRCTAEPVASCSPTTDYGTGGMFKVGFDIPAGTVIISPASDKYPAFYAIYTTSDATAMFGNSIVNTMTDEPVTIELSEGQYLNTAFGTIEVQE